MEGKEKEKQIVLCIESNVEGKVFKIVYILRIIQKKSV